MGKYLIDETTLTNIASAIRTKINSTGDIPVKNFANEILNIQSKEDLSAEITAQDAVIAQIQSALEGKAAGGSVDTCTVNFWNDIPGSGGTSVKFIVTCFSDIGTTDISNTGELFKMDNASIHNVVCGSLILAIPVSGQFSTTSYKIYINEDIVENITNTQYHYFTIPKNVNTEEINIAIGI
jgi:hypothetical protein